MRRQRRLGQPSGCLQEHRHHAKVSASTMATKIALVCHFMLLRGARSLRRRTLEAQEDRGAIRDRAHLLITNPDMLHCSMLPVHRQFGHFLANLRYVVVDEGHAYRGVFGCHAALVLRRLRRICQREYRRSPQFIVASATIANPQEHIQQLLGMPVISCVLLEQATNLTKKCYCSAAAGILSSLLGSLAIAWRRNNAPLVISWSISQEQGKMRAAKHKMAPSESHFHVLCRQDYGSGTDCKEQVVIAVSCATGVDHVHVVSEDGSPHGPKSFVLWNPPFAAPDRKGSGGKGLSMSHTEGRKRGGAKR